MKLEVSHPEGTPHEVELTGKVAVIGRDSSCDIVLNDDRCSRRHAVLEETEMGLVVRDTGSANGVFVNGRKLERSRLSPGDTIRIGETILEVLHEIGATVVVGPGDLDFLDDAAGPGPSASRTAPLSPPASRSSGRGPAGPPPRRGGPSRPPQPAGLPPTVTTLALLWALLAPMSVALGIALAMSLGERTAGGILAGGAGLVLGAFAGLMAVGLRGRAGWSRHLQIVAAVLGLFICPFTFASMTVLIYMLRPDVRAIFEGRSAPGAAGAGEAELTFALSLLGMLALGLVLTAGAALVL
jgi:hypothetical protein